MDEQKNIQPADERAAAQAEAPPHVINGGKVATPCRGLENEIPDALLRADVGAG